MTLTLELSEEMERALREAAARQQTSPESVVTEILGKYLNSSALERQAVIDQQEFDAIAEGVLRDNAELYRRLA